jgi:predicted N-acetyltransferase YhbS
MSSAQAVRSETRIEFVPAARQHVAELGRIAYEAFKDIQNRHGFEEDLPDVRTARGVVGMLVDRPDVFGVAALADGEPVGSNFLHTADAVAAVGPITVDCSMQGKGVGRGLMQTVLDFARSRKIERVRLMQDGFNMQSLSLYASLGFEVKEAAALLEPPPAAQDDPRVRAAVESDLPALERLSERIYRVSRRNDTAAAIGSDSAPLVIAAGGGISGYLVPGVFGHGVAESDEDALALVGQAARRLSPTAARFFCPLSRASLYRKALASGCRARKVMNLMALGPYEPPQGVWMPSIGY